ncbi:3-dehydroshikimate dehydratase [Sodiomyces alkalinus F11]|uniref:3-dehydroshikimate dehydratase n=1 Tax=Sodiomyces alkalinus (strain CBS 110278 / VKM F-3762 / F11) TaxID=1314773 RepID=A0A3N2Q5J3_SODAK|nr:3-dehydroshikimate dehydratase [Sodiomyces alkalinus F11]ROT41966.1 3-dehydroshikimate dehydratase [Sodiomyces alkalinus F11]
MPCRLAISTVSLGRCWAGHTLEHKLDMAAKYNYGGIELWHEDLMDMADRFPEGGASVVANQLAAARYVRQLCADRRLTILNLQPFQHYEGLVDRAHHARRVDEFRLWLRLCHALGTSLIAVASNVLPADQVSPDLDLHVADLREIADLAAAAAASPPVRLTFESLAWGTRVDTWEESWDVVCRVDRPNFGLCLDTFNMAGRIYADPAAETGLAGSGSISNAEEAVRASMGRLVASVDPARVFYVQVVDAERLREPLRPGHAFWNGEQPPRMMWSRNCRLFYGETSRGAYLPVREMAAAIFQGLGFEGWVSLELFHRRIVDEDPAVPEELAQRGALSWVKLVRDMRLVEAEDTMMMTASL